MSFSRKLSKLFSNPGGVLRTRWNAARQRFRYRNGSDYDAEQYWRDRHKQYGFDLRGVGDKTKSHEENVRLLDEGKAIFLKVCANAGVRFEGARTLDIGCGTGHFAAVLREQHVAGYLGIDITDALFAGLRERFPGFGFTKLDITSPPSEGLFGGTFDLIIAMDVLQHITDDAKFECAARAMATALNPGGVIVISTNLAGSGATGDSTRPMFYMVNRTLERFEQAFPGFELSPPLRYAESHVFSLARPK